MTARAPIPSFTSKRPHATHEAMQNEKGFRPRALGEIAIRCADLDAMTTFYTDVIGLTPLAGNYAPHIRFLRVAEGVAGHTTVLALFADGTEFAAGRGGSLHHLALSLPRAELDAVCAWYDRIGQPYDVQDFPWIGWRGVFTRDPEGNTVELVAYDASLKTSD